MVNIVQSLHIAAGSIRSAKMRSTTLGIVIGVAAVIANVSLGPVSISILQMCL
jgi:putative ABC transport system permease protein